MEDTKKAIEEITTQYKYQMLVRTILDSSRLDDYTNRLAVDLKNDRLVLDILSAIEPEQYAEKIKNLRANSNKDEE